MTATVPPALAALGVTYDFYLVIDTESDPQDVLFLLRSAAGEFKSLVSAGNTRVRGHITCPTPDRLKQLAAALAFLGSDAVFAPQCERGLVLAHYLRVMLGPDARAPPAIDDVLRALPWVPAITEDELAAHWRNYDLFTIDAILNIAAHTPKPA